jgi:hypothetical protein
MVRGGDKYLTKRKVKHVGFLIEFGFQLRKFMLEAFRENA